MNFTYYGHSCFSVATAQHTLLFDPFISGNPQASAIDLQTIKADFILLSHGHYDHVLDAVALANRTGATIIAGYEVAVWMAKQSAPKTHPINPGSTLFEFGRLRFVNAVHSSSLPDGSYGGQAGGFVVETAEGNFYYSGDTALTSDMELIGAGAPLTFAALCIGGNFTMDAADAVVPQIKIDHQQATRRFQEAGKKLRLLKIGESRKF
jgi:L-ascorbate metabolism protein UlaG (beta-lactamase superfamily)